MPTKKELLEEKTVKDLKQMARDKDISGYSRIPKAELVELIKKNYLKKEIKQWPELEDEEESEENSQETEEVEEKKEESEETEEEEEETEEKDEETVNETGIQEVETKEVETEGIQPTTRKTDVKEGIQEGAKKVKEGIQEVQEPEAVKQEDKTVKNAVLGTVTGFIVLIAWLFILNSRRITTQMNIVWGVIIAVALGLGTYGILRYL